MKRIPKVTMLLFCTTELMSAQNNTDIDTVLLPQIFEEERLLENSEDERGVLADEFDWLREHPMNLYTATAEELQRIPGVTHLLAENILAWRQQHPLLNITDLMNVEGMTAEQFRTMQPYIMLLLQNKNSYSVQYRYAKHFRNRTAKRIHRSCLSRFAVKRIQSLDSINNGYGRNIFGNDCA